MESLYMLMLWVFSSVLFAFFHFSKIEISSLSDYIGSIILIIMGPGAWVSLFIYFALKNKIKDSNERITYSIPFGFLTSVFLMFYISSLI